MSSPFKYHIAPVLAGIRWFEEEIPYPELDQRGVTFPIRWSADGNLSTSAGDPVCGVKEDILNGQLFSGASHCLRDSVSQPNVKRHAGKSLLRDMAIHTMR